MAHTPARVAEGLLGVCPAQDRDAPFSALLTRPPHTPTPWLLTQHPILLACSSPFLGCPGHLDILTPWRAMEKAAPRCPPLLTACPWASLRSQWPEPWDEWKEKGQGPTLGSGARVLNPRHPEWTPQGFLGFSWSVCTSVPCSGAARWQKPGREG